VIDRCCAAQYRAERFSAAARRAALKHSARYWAARNIAARKRAARDREQPVGPYDRRKLLTTLSVSTSFKRSAQVQYNYNTTAIQIFSFIACSCIAVVRTALSCWSSMSQKNLAWEYPYKSFTRNLLTKFFNETVQTERRIRVLLFNLRVYDVLVPAVYLSSFTADKGSYPSGSRCCCVRLAILLIYRRIWTTPSRDVWRHTATEPFDRNKIWLNWEQQRYNYNLDCFRGSEKGKRGLILRHFSGGLIRRYDHLRLLFVLEDE